MINKPTLQEVTTALNVINWAIDDLDIKASDAVVSLYKVLSDKEREFRAMDSYLAAVIQEQEQDTNKPAIQNDAIPTWEFNKRASVEDNVVNFAND